ncbi:hypothetical protein [Streptomyces sp. PSKA30]|uniref:hypothetical protein n=1 Tax=Streptomyces sp. PSKA30 TaxID=2874597 RepID=UPI001CD15C6B|nr:hypothetical protein [Streptomyces sp. PSKA30]MBZ9644735.1 hypothetical protein [Streptomyces sp. PSKA30]
MPESRIPKWRIWAAALAVVVVAGGVAGGVAMQPAAEARTLDKEPEVVAHAVESVEFESVGQMAVTSVAVVRAKVTAVNPGRIVGADETAEPGEESAATQARDVTLQVTEAYSRNNWYQFPDPITIEEWGWDASGDGYQVNNYSWSEVGKEYLFFLRKTSDPLRWNVISTEGRAEIDEWGFLHSSAEPGSALAGSIESYDVYNLPIYLRRIYDTKNPPEDMPTPAEMPAAGPTGYESAPIATPTAEPTDLGTNDGSEPTPYPSSS